MNDKYFITEDLFYDNKSLYKLSEPKNILINKRNWFSLLKNYGWGKIKLCWRKILESNYFSLLECGADGDCLFHVISEALNMDLIYSYEIPKYDISEIRKIASEGINFKIA